MLLKADPPISLSLILSPELQQSEAFGGSTAKRTKNQMESNNRTIFLASKPLSSPNRFNPSLAYTVHSAAKVIRLQP